MAGSKDRSPARRREDERARSERGRGRSRSHLHSRERVRQPAAAAANRGAHDRESNLDTTAALHPSSTIDEARPLSSSPPGRARERAQGRGRSSSRPGRDSQDLSSHRPPKHLEPSSDRISHSQRRRPDSPTHTKRRHSRSPSPSHRHRYERHTKRRRSRSPRRSRSRSRNAGPRGLISSRAVSPRPARRDGIVAARRSSPDYLQSSRRRSTSRDSKYRAEPRGHRKRVASPEDRYRDRYDNTHRRRSPRRDHRHRHTPSPPRNRRHREDRDLAESTRSRDAEHYKRPVSRRSPHRDSRHSPTPDRASIHSAARRPPDARSSRELPPLARPTTRRSKSPQGDRPSRPPAHSSGPEDRHRHRHQDRSLTPDRQRSDKPERESDMYPGGNPYYRYPPGQPPYSQGYPPNAFSSHHGSPAHYPPGQSPYRPPAAYSPPPPPAPAQSQYYQPVPGQRYGGTPNHPVYESAPGASRAAPAARGTSSMRGRGGHFANLSWTPDSGVRGGVLVAPGEKPPLRDDLNSKPAPDAKAASPDDEDNPFRPPAEMRAEDEAARKKRKISAVAVVGKTPEKLADKPAETTSEKESAVNELSSTSAEKEAEKSKISFSIKGRATASKEPLKLFEETLPSKKPAIPLSPLAAKVTTPKSSNYIGNERIDDRISSSKKDERWDDRVKRSDLFAKKPEPPRKRIERVTKKRLKQRPELTEELIESESVYFRKTGNDSVVGSGTYGKVYKGMHVYTKQMVALKKIRMEGERDGFPVTAMREIKLLQSLNHVNVVALQEVMVERNDCFMVFEYLSHDLVGLINHPTFMLTAGHKKHLAMQLFEGLGYLHQRGVLHRDIKAANILVSATGELKLADFGLARFYQKSQKQDYTNRVITIWYRSPELLLGETQYGPAVDIWSAACVLVEIFVRHPIFPGDGGEINQLDKIYNVLGTPSRNDWPGVVDLQWFELLRPSQRIPSTFAEKYRDRVSPEAFELLQAMFLYDPSLRPQAADIQEHPYFTTEEPKPTRAWELEKLDGDWHEFESKALRKQKEKKERDEKEVRRKERDDAAKRKAEEQLVGAEGKRPKTAEVPDP